ncbi:MAG TPA: MYG1 family protein [Candidatus Paceibacterota bacterium]|nr:MYG1 family protein [Candidatus Paceibacterota bacterium]
MQTIATHSGSFHADDAFAVAALTRFLAPEAVRIVRTRDEAVIAAAEWALDVGGEHDPARHRFDHHQSGAPIRENGIPYAAFGLIWQHVGEALAGSPEAAAIVDERLAQPIDAGDNGVPTYTVTELGIAPVTVPGVISLLLPEWGSTEKKDDAFADAVRFAGTLLDRAIAHARAELELAALIKEAYESASEKRVLSFDRAVPAWAFVRYPDVAIVVSPDDNGSWKANAIQKEPGTFETRVSFPERWAGLRDSALAEASGIADAVFCHKGRFLFIARSKEGALAAAALAA